MSLGFIATSDSWHFVFSVTLNVAVIIPTEHQNVEFTLSINWLKLCSQITTCKNLFLCISLHFFVLQYKINKRK